MTATKESRWWQPLIAWGVPAVATAAWFAGYDVWAGKTGHESASHEAQEGLANEVTGPFVFAAFASVVAGTFWHLLKGLKRP